MKQKHSMKQKCLVGFFSVLDLGLCASKKKRNLILVTIDIVFLFLRNEFSVENINTKFYNLSVAIVL